MPIELSPLEFEALSVRGRYLAFSHRPPLVLNLGSAAVVVVKILQAERDLDSARVRANDHFGARGISADGCARIFDDTVRVLRDADLLRDT